MAYRAPLFHRHTADFAAPGGRCLKLYVIAQSCSLLTLITSASFALNILCFFSICEASLASAHSHDIDFPALFDNHGFNGAVIRLIQLEYKVGIEIVYFNNNVFSDPTNITWLQPVTKIKLKQASVLKTF
jgi:hypothetical protein